MVDEVAALANLLLAAAVSLLAWYPDPRQAGDCPSAAGLPAVVLAFVPLQVFVQVLDSV